VPPLTKETLVHCEIGTGIVLNVISWLHYDRCRIAPSSAREGPWRSAPAVSKSALRRFHCGEQGCSFFRLRVQPVAQGWANDALKCGRQYSSASMIVITRLVTDGSAGSGEW
jgi:hypothetical protein